MTAVRDALGSGVSLLHAFSMNPAAPHYSTPHPEISQKQFWLSAYIAALHRVDHAAATAEADGALAACNKRWSNYAQPVQVWQSAHNCPVGFSDED